MLKTQKGLSWLKNASGDINQNSEGYKVAMDSLTYLRKETIPQLFYEIDLEKMVPIAMGEGAFSDQTLAYGQISHGGSFESGIVNTGAANVRLQTINTSIVAFTIAHASWMKGYDYTVFDIEKALFAGNWDLIAALMKALKLDWDLGIQKVAMLGGQGISSTLFPGLLTNSTVNVNLDTLLTADLSKMTPDQLDTFAATVMEAYRVNCNRTIYPTTWLMPEDEFNGLDRFTSVAFAQISRSEYLKKIFAAKNVEIIPCKYGMAAESGLAVNRHVLYNKSEDNLLMEIPVPFNFFAPGTANNITWEQGAIGSFSGVAVFRPTSMLYLDRTV